MKRVLVIVPTKDRSECLNIFIQNLIMQDEFQRFEEESCGVEKVMDFDVFIADMSTEPLYLKNNWLVDTSTRRFAHLGHNWAVVRVPGNNQLYGYQAGLEFARDNGYEYAFAGDDDIVLSLGWLDMAFRDLESPFVGGDKASCVCGPTLIPWESEESQKQDGIHGVWSHTEEFQGKLEPVPHFFHVTRIPPDNKIREYEQIYGPFMLRVKDFLDVGGFPTWLSRLGFRGEMMAQTATFFNGRKLLLDPTLKSWHYSVSTGGLRWVQGDDRKDCLEQDMKSWQRFMSLRKPTTRKGDIWMPGVD